MKRALAAGLVTALRAATAEARQRAITAALYLSAMRRALRIATSPYEKSHFIREKSHHPESHSPPIPLSPSHHASAAFDPAPPGTWPFRGVSMKLPNKSGKKPTNKQTSDATQQADKPPRRRPILKPQTVAWMLVLTVFGGAVAYAAGGGVITLNGATSGTVTVQVPAVAGSTTFQFPQPTAPTAMFFRPTARGSHLGFQAPAPASTALSALRRPPQRQLVRQHQLAQTWNVEQPHHANRDDVES